MSSLKSKPNRKPCLVCNNPFPAISNGFHGFLCFSLWQKKKDYFFCLFNLLFSLLSLNKKKKKNWVLFSVFFPLGFWRGFGFLLITKIGILYFSQVPALSIKSLFLLVQNDKVLIFSFPYYIFVSSGVSLLFFFFFEYFQ